MEGGPNIQEAEHESLLPSEEQHGSQRGWMFKLWDPRGGLHRFIALLFMCFLGFGSYFCYDNPAALQDHMEQDLNITSTQFMMFYSLYSWPNVILCFVGGFLIDKVFGVRLGANIYMLILVVGQICFASGVMINTFWIMAVGRFVFGIGAESLAVAQNNYAVLWFKGKELNTVFGLQLSFARIGSTVSFMVMEDIYDWAHQKFEGAETLGIALFIALTTCILSMVCSLVLGLMDKRAERILLRAEMTTGDSAIRLSDVKTFINAPFWLVCTICVFYYIAIFPFIGLAKEFFEQRFDMNAKDANFICSMLYLISGIASPVLGFIIDKSGRNVFWIMFAVSSTMLAHCLLAFTLINPYVDMVLMGVTYSILASSLWPLVSLIIPEHQLGTAYGICQAIQNLGLAVFDIVAGDIQKNYGYIWLEIFFIISLAIALVATVLLWILDLVRKGTLNMSPSARQEQQQTLLAAQALETEKLLTAEVDSNSELMQPNSDFHIRNSCPLPTA